MDDMHTLRHISVLPDKMARFLAEDFLTADIKKYDDYAAPCDRPLPVILPVPEGLPGAGEAKFSLFLSGREVLTTAVLTQAEIYNLLVGVPYRYVFFRAGKECAGGLIIDDEVRPIYADGIRNVRDCGNQRAEGGVLRQGLLYRGSEMNNVSDHALCLTPCGWRTLRSQLGIVTDIDLRSESEAEMNESPLGVYYFRRHISGYVDMFSKRFDAAVRDIFTLLADRERYPAYIHCWAGADRTGTLIAVLKAALGVSYRNITRDFELSTLSMFGLRGRSNRDFTYNEVFEHLSSLGGGDIKRGARHYLFEQAGVSRQTFAALREILVEGD